MRMTDRATDIAIGAVSALAVIAVGGVITLTALSANAPETDPETIAAEFGISVVWFTDEPPCGTSDLTIGCYDTDTPTVIYVAEGLAPDVERSVILHEIGHALRDRLGLPNDECAADKFAESMSATYLAYDC